VLLRKYKRVRYKGIALRALRRRGLRALRWRRERMGQHRPRRARSAHIWFFKGVPSRIGYPCLEWRPRKLGENPVGYRGVELSIHLGRTGGALARPATLEAEMQAELDRLARRSASALMSCASRDAARVEFLQSGPSRASATRTTCGPSRSTSTSRSSPTRSARMLVKDVQRSFNTPTSTTPRPYYEDARQRLRTSGSSSPTRRSRRRTRPRRARTGR